MKVKLAFVLAALAFMFLNSWGQSDTSSLKKASENLRTHADSVSLARLNYAGNMMIAGGVGLCIAGGYLLYEGINVYNSPVAANSQDPTGDKSRNQRQGTIYMAAAGIAGIGGIVLMSLGARNKIEFKQRKKIMSVQSGLLDNGRLGAMLTF
jgi:hypothetical protein